MIWDVMNLWSWNQLLIKIMILDSVIDSLLLLTLLLFLIVIVINMF